MLYCLQQGRWSDILKKLIASLSIFLTRKDIDMWSTQKQAFYVLRIARN